MPNLTSFTHILGIDEAGRGPLAGPVAVGAVLLPVTRIDVFPSVRDSKQLSPAVRDEWYHKLLRLRREGALTFSTALIGPDVIDARGIVAAVRLGIARTMRSVGCDADRTLVLLDGGLRAPIRFVHQQTITRGDAQESAIALASIAAKVRRDRYMVQLAQQYPEYALETHKGYGTEVHRRLIKEHGISKIHRKTFTRTLTL